MDEVDTFVTHSIEISTLTPSLFPPSSSQSSHELTFVVHFVLENFVTRRDLDLFGNNHVMTTYEERQFGLQPRTTFSVVVPSDQDGWDHQARSALAYLGIDPVFHDDVVGELCSRVHVFASALADTTTTRVDLVVYLHRRTVHRSPVLLPQPNLDEVFDLLSVILDDIWDDNDLRQGLRADVNDDENQETTSCVTERVDANEWNTLQGKDCAVCLEQFQEVQLMGNTDNLDHKIKDGDRAATRLPCKHVFHESCIMTWFKNSHLCPLCRSDCSQQAVCYQG